MFVPGFTILIDCESPLEECTRDLKEQKTQGATASSQAGLRSVKLLFLPVADSPPADRGR